MSSTSGARSWLPTIVVGVVSILFLYSARRILTRKPTNYKRITTRKKREDKVGKRGGTGKSCEPEQNLQIHIWFGSQTGTSEQYAEELMNDLKIALKPYKIDPKDDTMVQYAHRSLESWEDMVFSKNVLNIFLVATYGEGDPPDAAVEFYDFLKKMNDEMIPMMKSMNYAVFGFGSRQYTHFNNAAIMLDAHFQRVQGQRFSPEIGMGDDSDGKLEETFATWQESVVVNAKRKLLEFMKVKQASLQSSEITTPETKQKYDQVIATLEKAAKSTGVSENKTLEGVLESLALDSLVLGQNDGGKSGSSSFDTKVIEDFCSDNVTEEPKNILGKALFKVLPAKIEQQEELYSNPTLGTVKVDEFSAIIGMSNPTSSAGSTSGPSPKGRGKEVKTAGCLNVDLSLQFRDYKDLRPDIELREQMSTEIRKNWTKDYTLASNIHVLPPNPAECVNFFLELFGFDTSSQDRASSSPNSNSTADLLSMPNWISTRNLVGNAAKAVKSLVGNHDASSRPKWSVKQAPGSGHRIESNAKGGLDPLKTVHYWSRKNLSRSTTVKVPFPSGHNITQIFTYFLDLRTLPSKAVLEKLALFLVDPSETKVEDTNKFAEKWIHTVLTRDMLDQLHSKRVSFAGFIEMFMLPYLKIGLNEFLQLCPQQQTRVYTASSSGLGKTAKTASITLSMLTEEVKDAEPAKLIESIIYGKDSVTDRQKSASDQEFLSQILSSYTLKCENARAQASENTEGKAAPQSLFLGTCSSYIINGANRSMLISVSPPTMKFPENVNVPVIMIGAGTGIAPFKGFIDHEIEMQSKKREMCLFFGCRHRHEDFLYGDFLEDLHCAGKYATEHEKRKRESDRRKQALESADEPETMLPKFRLIMAFSRMSKKKVYVQDKLLENKDVVKDLLVDRDGVVMVCGSTRMGKSVQNTLAEILGREVFNKLQTSGRYSEEVW